jgi:hypothetical protein
VKVTIALALLAAATGGCSRSCRRGTTAEAPVAHDSAPTAAARGDSGAGVGAGGEAEAGRELESELQAPVGGDDAATQEVQRVGGRDDGGGAGAASPFGEEAPPEERLVPEDLPTSAEDTAREGTVVDQDVPDGGPSADAWTPADEELEGGVEDAPEEAPEEPPPPAVDAGAADAPTGIEEPPVEPDPLLDAGVPFPVP